jgi:hypothetical protein
MTEYLHNAASSFEDSASFTLSGISMVSFADQAKIQPRCQGQPPCSSPHRLPIMTVSPAYLSLLLGHLPTTAPV